jgi:rhamnosyltransferase
MSQINNSHPNAQKALSTFAVIVTFNGDWDNVAMLASSLVDDGVGYIVVDNGSADHQALGSMNTVFLGENLGIAAAQNVGIQHCLERGAEVIVFFDQDSVIKSGFIAALIEPILQNAAFITAPVFYDTKKGFGYPIVKFSRHGFRTKFRPDSMSAPVVTNVVISSGSAVSVDVFRAVGLMNAKLFIDYVDTEWCLRCFSKGFTVLVNPAVRMEHSIGDTTIVIGRFKIPVHSPLRRYYRIRNSFLLLRLPHVPKVLVFREIIFSLAHQMVIILVSKKPLAYMKYAFFGIVHGLANRGGRYS